MSHLSSTKGREEDPGNYRPVNLTSVSRKIMGKFFLEATTRLKMDKVFQKSQRRLTNDVSYLTNLTTFSDKKTTSVDETRAAGVILILVTVYQSVL